MTGLYVLIAAAMLAQPAAVDSLAASASRWAAAFEQDLSGLLFREQYLQAADVGYSADYTLRSRRTELRLEANVFLLRVPGRQGFVVYRDVYRAGGQDVTDHTERLQHLLTVQTADSLAQAQRLTDASARYNVGSINRNVNTPTMAFEFLTEANIGRLQLREAARETIDGLACVVVAFDETARPTLVRGERGADVPARGRYWIDPITGAVPRAIVEFDTGGYSGRIEVRLARHPALKAWVPVEMSEAWTSPTSNASGTARYDRFQRLAVSTEEIVK